MNALIRMSFDEPEDLRTSLIEPMRPLLPEDMDIDEEHAVEEDELPAATWTTGRWAGAVHDDGAVLAYGQTTLEPAGVCRTDVGTGSSGG